MDSWSSYQRIDSDNSENEDEEEDLAELEALLYSQIHYSQEEEQINKDVSLNDDTEHRTVDSSFSVKSYKEVNTEEEVAKDLLDKDGDTFSDADSGCGESRTITPFVDSMENDEGDDSRENEGRVDKKDGNETLSEVKDCDTEEESRYASVKPKHIESQVISSDSDSDESEDDGIVVLPKPLQPEPEIICIDSSSPVPSISDNDIEDSSSDDEEKGVDNVQINPFYNSKDKISKDLNKSTQNDSVVILNKSEQNDSVVILTDKPEPNESVVVVSESPSPSKSKNSQLLKFLKKTKPQTYKVATDSDTDSSDSYSGADLSDDSVECLDTDMSLGNVLGTTCSNRKRKMVSMSEILGKNVRDVAVKDNMKCYSWTQEMDKYYNDIILENVDMELEDILQKIPKHAKFDVNRSDVYRGGPERKRYFQSGVKCNNCGQYGHMSRFCPEPLKTIHCRMCGGEGHYETRCPAKCCLGCGQPGGMFLESCLHCRNKQQFDCKECGERGHLKKDCPDLWRRFHLTTEPGDVIQPIQDSHKKANKTWCCNCAKKGHLVDQCRRYLYSKYPAPNLTVTSYAEPTSLQGFDTPEKLKEANTSKNDGGENVAYVTKTLEKYRSNPFVSKFMKTQPQSYGEPKSKKQRREEQREMKKAERKMNRKAQKFGLFQSEPGSPASHSTPQAQKKAASEPCSPMRNNKEIPATALVEKAIEKLSGKDKWKLKRQEKRDNKKIFKLAGIVGDKANVHELLKDYEVDVEAMTKCLKNKKQKKVQKENANFFRKEIQERQKEFGDKRGFGKKTDLRAKLNESQFRAESQSRAFIPLKKHKGLKGELDFPRSKKNEKVDLIPGNVKAAIRVLNKEVNNDTNSPGAKKIKKDIRSEIWCMKNSLAQGDQLKKVERIRLADMVLQLKTMS